MTDLVVDALAAYRITRFIQLDGFPPMALVRERIHKDGSDYLVELLDCPFCVGMWVSAGVVIARRWLPGWAWISRVLALSALVGTMAIHEGD